MSGEDVEAIWARQAEMHPDFERLETAGQTIPELWTGIFWDDGDLVVLVTDPDLAAPHLLPGLEHPDRVHVRTAKYTRRHLDEIHQQVLDTIDGLRRSDVWSSHGPGLETVDLALRSPEHALAQRLRDQFGDALELRLGAHPYPPPTAAPAPRPAPAADLQLPQLTLIPQLEEDTVPAGGRFRGTVTLYNTGGDALEVYTGNPARAVVLDEQSHVVGVYNGAVAGTGRGLQLQPGGLGTVRFIGGTDPLDHTLGATLPPGTYRYVIRLKVTIGSEHGQHGTLVTPAAQIRII